MRTQASKPSNRATHPMNEQSNERTHDLYKRIFHSIHDSWTAIQLCKIFSISDGNVAMIWLSTQILELILFNDKIILSFKR